MLASSLLNIACSAFSVKACKENCKRNHNVGIDVIIVDKTTNIIYSIVSNKGRHSDTK